MMLSTIISSIESMGFNEDYVKHFRTAVLDSGIENDTVLLQKIYEKLNVNNLNTYYAGVSEVMFYLHFSKAGISIFPDAKLKTKEAGNKDSKKDVDLRIENNRFIFNIEIKTPEKDNYDPTALKGRLVYRGIQPKEEADSIMDETKTLLANELKNQGSEQSVLIQKLQDNKLKDYLSSAQSKFPSLSNTNELNILCVCVPIQKMPEY